MEAFQAEALAKGLVKGVWEKSSEIITEKSKKMIDSLKVDLGTAFSSYLEISYTKYSTIKTLLYRDKLRKLRDFFVIPDLQSWKQEEDTVSAVNSTVVRNFAGENFIIVQGMGGIGKSMLMKHLFLSELEECGEFIPIFFELKDINGKPDDYNLIDVIFEGMHILDESTSKNAIEYALKRGMFMILLDGLDEMESGKAKSFTKKLNDFCDKYPKNNVIISSRPINDFIHFEKFAVLDTMGMDKKQAISLIKKLEYDGEVKGRFIKALDDELFENHEEFASSPLLLTMMFLTYDEFSEIPETPYLFYERAFETLLTKHDSTKSGGYIRIRESKLNSEQFKKVLATFCCITYYNNAFSFSENELTNTLKKVKAEVAGDGIDFDVEKYIPDLTNAVCMLYKEGFTYSFTHRSFQEYFTAVYLKDQTDDIMEKRGLAIIKSNPKRARNDRTFAMLSDMAKNKFEKNILLPLLNEIEKDFKGGDKYDFYFEKTVEGLLITGYDEMLYAWSTEPYGLISFVEKLYLQNWFMLDSDTLKKEYETICKHLKDTDGKCYVFRESNIDIKSTEMFANWNDDFSVFVYNRDAIYCGDDKVLYELMRETQIGQKILAVSTARETLTAKYAVTADADDFFSI
ncbi:MAG: NACHT domain-containing protein [Defluviitaleaceae bacterium]|nr:NACHT domain-containing protein [Defluviitaleaceae bacterium]MCL2263614.1 NACHT domain-containing protein [Defluviitaleaceae bacterium]